MSTAFKKSFDRMGQKPVFKILKNLAGLIILMVVFSILTPKFFTLDNLLTITLQMAIYCLLALGICYVLLVGGAELSAGSIVGLTGMTFVCSLQAGQPVIVAILLALAIGMVVGICNGFMVAKMKLIPFIATLGMQYIARGFCQIIANGTSVSLRNAVTDDKMYEVFKFIGSGRVFGSLPAATLIVLAFLVLHYIILNKTVFGRKVYAVGSNPEAAKLSGIKTDKIVMIAYLISAFMATMAGLLYTMRVTIAQASGGVGYEFEGIAACVIGGISMMGGEGSVIGALIGASTLAVMRNGMNLIGINSYWQNVVTGVVIVGAVYLDIRRRSKEASRL
ncbi:MAG: ABC transporter permease [Clostridia bacterium]